MQRAVIAILAGSMLAAPLYAQDASPAASRLADEVEETLVLFEFEQDERMTLPILLEGHGGYRFMVDTGAERSAVSSELAEELGLIDIGTRRVVSFAGTSRIPAVEAASLMIAPGADHAGELLTFKRRAIGADGVLGIDSLQDKTVTFDFANNQMRIRKSGDAKLSAGTREVAIALDDQNGRMIISSAEIDGLDVDMIIDTGSAVSVGNLSLRDALRRRGKLSNLTEGLILTFTGELVQAEVGTIRNVRVDGFTIARMPVAFVNSTSFEYLGYGTEPVLYFGMEAMRAFQQLEIDFANKQALFKTRDAPGFSPRSTWFLEQQRKAQTRPRPVPSPPVPAGPGG